MIHVNILPEKEHNQLIGHAKHVLELYPFRGENAHGQITPNNISINCVTCHETLLAFKFPRVSLTPTRRPPMFKGWTDLILFTGQWILISLALYVVGVVIWVI